MTAIFIGKGLLEIAPVLGIITGSVKSICSLIDSMSYVSNGKNNYDDSEVYEFIDSLDIRDKLDTYSLLINEFPGTRSLSVKNSLIGVKNVIVEIEKHLMNIKKKSDYNKRLWILSSMRSYSMSKDLRFLERLIKKLDSRIEALKTVTEISRLWNSRLFVPIDIDVDDKKPLPLTYYSNYCPNFENDNTTINHQSLDASNISYIVVDKNIP